MKKMEGRPSVVGEGQVRGGGGEEVMKRKLREGKGKDGRRSEGWVRGWGRSHEREGWESEKKDGKGE